MQLLGKLRLDCRLAPFYDVTSRACFNCWPKPSAYGTRISSTLMGGVEWLAGDPPDGTLSFLFWLFIARVESSNIKSSSSSSAEKCLFVCRVRILLLENKRAISITKKTIDDAQHVHTIFDTFYIRFSADDETGWDNAHHSFGMTHFEFIKRTQGRCKCCTNLSTFSGCWSFQLIQLLVIPRWRYSSLWTD